MEKTHDFIIKPKSADRSSADLDFHNDNSMDATSFAPPTFQLKAGEEKEEKATTPEPTHQLASEEVGSPSDTANKGASSQSAPDVPLVTSQLQSVTNAFEGEEKEEKSAAPESTYQLAAEGIAPPNDNPNEDGVDDQSKPNNTGLPTQLKSGVESLSGFSLDDVKVHYNSSKPAQLKAHAYAQGTDIHLASGQESLLPHEAWHVVQQKQDRVQPTTQFKAFNINDDAGLEKEADEMGAKAIQSETSEQKIHLPKKNESIPNMPSTTKPVQQVSKRQRALGHSTSQPIQGNFLDKSEKKSSFSTTINDQHKYKWPKEIYGLSKIKSAIERYEETDTASGGIDVAAQKSAAENLRRVILAQKSKLDRFQATIDHLEMEVNLIIADFVYCEAKNSEIEDENWKLNPDNIRNTQLETTSRMQKYGGEKASYKGDRAINRGILMALSTLNSKIKNYGYDLLKKFKELDADFGEDIYEFGEVNEQEDRIEARLSGENLDKLDDYENLKSFLADKELVLTSLLPLAAKIKELFEDNNNIVESFTQALRHFERPAGFEKEPIVPLGILPADVFIRLMSEGNILDDYGAGLQHGEYSHRLQWVAIIEATSNGDIPLKNSVIDLYTSMNLPPFSQFRTGNSMWGSTLDKGTNASDSTYSAPGTLNRDLMELDTEHFDADSNIGKEKWDKNKTEPPSDDFISEQGSNLAPIGHALNEMKKLRIQMAQNVPEEDRETNTWKGYGAPSDAMASEYANHLIQDKGYTEFDSGEVSNDNPFSSQQDAASPWKILSPPVQTKSVTQLKNSDSSFGNTGQSEDVSQSKINSSLPEKLRIGMESLSGFSLDDVKVHYNSDKPAQLQAHAYAQGTDIHVASGQEKYLPHEAWHVVQQKQGRVQPTTQLKAFNINDDARLEKEADEMGKRAMQNPSQSNIIQKAKLIDNKSAPFQLEGFKNEFDSNSIGTEQELVGVKVFMSENARQRIGIIKLNDITLMEVTKDMSVGPPTFFPPPRQTVIKDNWYTIEIVGHPYEIEDQAAKEDYKATFNHLVSAIETAAINNVALESQAFANGAELDIKNPNHIIKPKGDLDEFAKVSSTSNQATVGVPMNSIGTGENGGEMIEEAVWYDASFKQIVLSDESISPKEDPNHQAANAFAYVASVIKKLVQLQHQFKIYLEGAVEPFEKGLTDPAVKNSWGLLPRTHVITVFDDLEPDIRRKLYSLVDKLTFGSEYNETNVTACINHIKTKQDLAGHAIKKLPTIDNEKAHLFEYREPSLMPDSLQDAFWEPDPTREGTYKSGSQINLDWHESAVYPGWKYLNVIDGNNRKWYMRNNSSEEVELMADGKEDEIIDVDSWQSQFQFDNAQSYSE